MPKRNTFFPPAPKPSTTGTLVYMLFGPLVWAVQFTLAYGGHTLVCARGGAPWISDVVVLAATALTAVLLVCFLVWQERCAGAFGQPAPPRRDRPTDGIARILAFLSLVAVFWGGATVGLLDACVLGR
ncbi:hypothetical protein [Nitratireductor sp. ZSWI3]|uniref:hypothetical protein n=1 Tax=Nitratireductor sp. ZSWI3 TaxID=2966359 RepID=UPI00214FC555|nr:hypothetical protein [Nitratireductor sp. ZSWI3]MCR4264673.1 hypothetical protein [Nitratireductor sp. ZSWI3]